MNDQTENLYSPDFIEINRIWAKEHLGFVQNEFTKEPVRFFGPEYKGRQVISIAHHEYCSVFAFQCHPEKIAPTYAHTVSYYIDPQDFKTKFLSIKSIYLKKAVHYTGVVHENKISNKYEYK